MKYSPGEAAKLLGRNKSTVLRAIQSGKLSATRREDGTLSIDASELARVYDLHPGEPLRAGAMPQSAATHAAPAAPVSEATEVALLQLELRMTKDQLTREREEYRETVDDLRRRLDQEQEERRNLQRQLAAPAQPAPQPAQERPSEVPVVSEPPKASRGFLARLLGR